MMVRMNWEELQATLCERVRAQRGAQAEIARRLDISRAAVAEYIKGGRNIPTGHLSVMLDVLNLELELKPRPPKDS